jgi:hypothetical protein
MGSVTSSLIKNWRKNDAVRRLLKAHMPREAKVIEVSLLIYSRHSAERAKQYKNRKYAEVIYLLNDKLFRAEFKLRADRHWGRNDKRKREGIETAHFTASDLLGQERVSSTEEVDGRLQL